MFELIQYIAHITLVKRLKNALLHHVGKNKIMEKFNGSLN